MELSDRILTRWRRVLLLREVRVTEEFGRQSFCPMCSLTMPTWRLQCHHIYPKSIYPERAYDLDNGICLCQRCHMGIVHAGNPWVDIKRLSHWRFFVAPFRRYVGLARCRDFNRDNQGRVR